MGTKLRCARASGASIQVYYDRGCEILTCLVVAGRSYSPWYRWARFLSVSAFCVQGPYMVEVSLGTYEFQAPSIRSPVTQFPAA
ncbi:hypothetical protein Tco_0184928 [Tanacetum coccineum]